MSFLDYLLNYNDSRPKDFGEILCINKGKTLTLENSYGSWIISDNGAKLRLTSTGQDDIYSFYSVYDETEIHYYMNNGHVLRVFYNKSSDSFGIGSLNSVAGAHKKYQFA
jgi:hypothetical protein